MAEPTFEVEPEQTLPRSLVEKLVILALVFGLVGGLAGGWVWQKVSPGTGVKSFVESGNSAVVNVAKQVSPSVVSITTESTINTFFGFSQQIGAAGTGIIITPDGLILTNKHVVPAGTQQVSVFTADGTQYKGRVVARDPINDLALVKVDGHGLPAAKLGDSGAMQVGQQVTAIGNALGQFQNTVTTGIISGLGRPIEAGDESGSSSESLSDLFQTDAAINPGNSGGPLVNLSGEVIGINTAVAGGAQNIGFAIPINEAKPDIASYQKNGKILKPFLGVRFVSLNKSSAARLHLAVSEGAYLDPSSGDPIVAGGPADKAGLKGGDVITKVGSDAVDQNHSLTSLIGEHQPGDSVTLTVNRDGKTLTVNVTLAQTPNS